MEASVVITNHNTWDLTLRCVRALELHSGSRLREIVVVDDASSAPAPSDFPSSVRLVRNAKNLGYQASVNVGFAAVSGDWVLLLDSDACPLMDVVEPLGRAFAADPRLGAVALRTVDDERRGTQSAQDAPSALGLLLGPRLEPSYMTWRAFWDTRPIVVYSCALGVRRAAFESVGGFDTGFDFLDADIDFSLRLSEAGWDTRLEQSLLAIHAGSGSPQTQARRVLRHYRNRFRLLEKHQKLGAPALLKLGLALRHVAEIKALWLLIPTARAPEQRALYKEKLRVRHRLLQTVWSGYREANR